MIWWAAGAGAALVGGLLFWWIRRRRRHRLISFVALLRESVTFDPVVLARLAGKAWDADLGDGTSQGADGFVAGGEISSVVVYGGRFFLLNTFARPYVEDPEESTREIPDTRIRNLFAEHKAWFSCDAMGVNGATPEEEVGQWYRRLGKLFAELLDENCLLILVPDTHRAYPINEDTEAALRSDDPLRSLQETLTVPLLEVADDDPEMQRAVAKARQDWPKFVAAFEASAGETFSIKAPVTHSDNTEFIWISVTSIEGERVYGTLGNDPADLGPLKLGSKVSVLVADVNDWVYMDSEGKLAGGFTVEAVRQAAGRRRKGGYKS